MNITLFKNHSMPPSLQRHHSGKVILRHMGRNENAYVCICGTCPPETIVIIREGIDTNEDAIADTLKHEADHIVLFRIEENIASQLLDKWWPRTRVDFGPDEELPSVDECNVLDAVILWKYLHPNVRVDMEQLFDELDRALALGLRLVPSLWTRSLDESLARLKRYGPDKLVIR